MRANDAAACNLFGCLTSLAVEEGSRRIENFCTESLACLLRNSCELQKTFFGLLRYYGSTSGFEFSTQVFVKPGDLRDAEKSYFDMVALNETERRAFIVEVKASTGFRPDQLPKYREAAKRKYQGYRLKLATLSPHVERPPASDIHLCWDQIATATRQTRSPAAMHGIFNQFSDFLDEKGLTNMKLEPILPATLKQWNDVVAHQEETEKLIRLLFNNEDLKPIFGRTREPKRDYPKGKRSWIGIYSTSQNPSLYAGIGIMDKGVALLWVEATVNCNGAPSFTSLPVALSKPYQAAKKYYTHKIDYWANAGRSKDGKTTLVFVQELDSRLGTDSKAVVDWLKDTTLAAARFVSK